MFYKTFMKVIESQKKTIETLRDITKSAIMVCDLERAIFKRRLNSPTTIKVKLDEGAKIPTRAHSTDAGLDIYAREGQVISARGSAEFDTGVHIELPEGTVGFLKSKSGLNVKFGIQSNGTIDVGYIGSIRVKLYNHSDEDYEVKAGDKISQLVILPILTPTPYLVDSLEESERGENGFGSSGR